MNGNWTLCEIELAGQNEHFLVSYQPDGLLFDRLDSNEVTLPIEKQSSKLNPKSSHVAISLILRT